MKIFLLSSTLLLCTACLFAQSDKEKASYAEKATQLQTELWGSPAAEFKETSVPANFKKESAVILARSFSLQRSSAGKIKFGRAIRITTRTTKLTILHERVKINDKTALESFSSLEYQKQLDRTTSELFARNVDVNNTFIGAKVIKPSGKEIVINTSEEVLTTNEAKDKKGKLAIPELQVGDVLDFYICKEDVADKEEGNAYKDNDNVIVLAEEYPTLSYSLNFQFSKKIKVQHIYANGAPGFEESHNADGDLLLSLKMHNVPKYESQLWASSLRQYPYIEIASAYDDAIDKIIEKNNFSGKTAMFRAQKYVFEKEFADRGLPLSSTEDRLKEYFGGKKNFKNMTLDTIMKIMYSQWKYKTFWGTVGYFRTGGERRGDDLSGLNYRSALSKPNAAYMSMVLTDMKIDHDVLLVSSRYSNNLDNVFNQEDFDALIRINGEKPMYMCFDDVFTHFNEIPERYQGERVIIMHPKRRNNTEFDFTESEGVMPVSTADHNYIEEELNVNFLDAGMSKLKIDRRVKQAGGLRHEDQKTLLLPEDINRGYTSIGMKEEPVLMTKKDRKLLEAMLEKDRMRADKNFSSEIKAKYDQEPQQVSNCKVINNALEQNNPIFEYSGTFVLDNLVKKAGSNYIIDAGKLTGGFLKLDEKDKKRDKDVYMQVARTFKYTIVIDIPRGYAARGMEEMTQKKFNKTGSFSSSATVNGSKLTITVSRVYAHNFEKAADWPLLVDIINTASDFTSKKILLEKKG
jgi:hypothetical protein